MAGARPGRRPGARRRRGDPRRRRPAADARPIPRPWPGSRAALRHAAARGLFDADDAARRRRRGSHGLRRRLARGRAAADSTSSAVRRRTGRSRASSRSARSRWSATTPGCCRSGCPPTARGRRVMPAPRDLTPADTSSIGRRRRSPAALRRRHRRDGGARRHERVGRRRSRRSARRSRARTSLVVGTISASLGSRPGRAVGALLATGTPTVTVALRTPLDLAAYPSSATHVCTYGILGRRARPSPRPCSASCPFARPPPRPDPRPLPCRARAGGSADDGA